MKDEDFYAECAAILNTVVDGEAFPYHKRTRWNNRKPGRGRFPGFGIIRAFGDLVHMHLYSPIRIEKVFLGKDEALAFLRENATGV